MYGVGLRKNIATSFLRLLAFARRQAIDPSTVGESRASSPQMLNVNVFIIAMHIKISPYNEFIRELY